MLTSKERPDSTTRVAARVRGKIKINKLLMTGAKLISRRSPHRFFGRPPSHRTCAGLALWSCMQPLTKAASGQGGGTRIQLSRVVLLQNSALIERTRAALSIACLLCFALFCLVLPRQLKRCRLGVPQEKQSVRRQPRRPSYPKCTGGRVYTQAACPVCQVAIIIANSRVIDNPLFMGITGTKASACDLIEEVR